MTHKLNPVVIGTITQKRLGKDYEILQKDPMEYFDAKPDENNMLIWYCLLRGPECSEYKNGLFLGKITHDPEYPLKPPMVQMLTPSGRYEINKNICLSFTGFHADQWSAMWNIKTILSGFLSNMLEDKQAEQGIAYIKNTPEQRATYAKNSIEYNLKHHAEIYKSFTRFVNPDGSQKSNEEVIASLKPEKKKKSQKTDEPSTDTQSATANTKKEETEQTIIVEATSEKKKKKHATHTVTKEEEEEIIEVVAEPVTEKKKKTKAKTTVTKEEDLAVEEAVVAELATEKKKKTKTTAKKNTSV